MISVQNNGPSSAIVTFEVSRIDAAISDELKDALGAIVSGGVRHLILDFENIDFLDSSGLGALVGCKKMLGATGKIEIARPNEKVFKVLKLTRMHQIFAISDNLSKAS